MSPPMPCWKTNGTLDGTGLVGGSGRPGLRRHRELSDLWARASRAARSECGVEGGHLSGTLVSGRPWMTRVPANPAGCRRCTISCHGRNPAPDREAHGPSMSSLAWASAMCGPSVVTSRLIASAARPGRNRPGRAGWPRRRRSRGQGTRPRRASRAPRPRWRRRCCVRVRRRGPGRGPGYRRHGRKVAWESAQARGGVVGVPAPHVVGVAGSAAQRDEADGRPGRLRRAAETDRRNAAVGPDRGARS